MGFMTKLRHQQPSLWHPGLTKDIEDLWEPWMRLVDRLLEDEQLLDTIYEAQGERYPQSRRLGREQTPAEVVLRLLLLKHIRNWSYDTLEREVRANLVYRAFTRIGDEKVPDAKTLARLGQLIGPEVMEELHQRIVQLAQEHGVTSGRKLRVDTTVVETNIHYPTDSSLLGDGTRVLTRTMKKIEQKAGGLKRKVRDRMRSVRKRVLAIALSTRYLGAEGEARRKKQYRELLSLTRKTVNQAQRILEEVKAGPPLSPHSPAKLSGIAGDDDGAGAASGETDQATNLCRDDQVAGKDRERVRVAHGNHSQRQGQQADRIWQAGQDPGIGESNHQPFRSFCRTAQRPAVVSAVDRGPPAEIWSDSGLGGRGCGVPLAAE